MIIKDFPVDDLKPYDKNPRINDNSVPKVAESIKQFGFKVPLVIDADNVIVTGHTRFKAALSLGLKSVPCIVADDLTPEQIKAFRLADNKVGESSLWDDYFLSAELSDLARGGVVINMSDFGFDDSQLFKRRKSWAHLEKKCGLKKKIKQHSNGDMMFTSFYEVGKEGKPIAEIKEDKSNVPIFADNLCDYLDRTLGLNIAKGGWCILTTPRRRHKDGFHFSTEICKTAAESLNLPFYDGAFEADNRNRIIPEFRLVKDPAESNCILYDDIITTGQTVKTCRQMLIDKGHVTLLLIGIKNQ